MGLVGPAGCAGGARLVPRVGTVGTLTTCLRSGHPHLGNDVGEPARVLPALAELSPAHLSAGVREGWVAAGSLAWVCFCVRAGACGSYIWVTCVCSATVFSIRD